MSEPEPYQGPGPFKFSERRYSDDELEPRLLYPAIELPPAYRERNNKTPNKTPDRSVPALTRIVKTLLAFSFVFLLIAGMSMGVAGCCHQMKSGCSQWPLCSKIVHRYAPRYHNMHRERMP